MGLSDSALPFQGDHLFLGRCSFQEKIRDTNALFSLKHSEIG